VRDFFKTYYAPNNASIAVVGDFDTTKVKALIGKYFGPIPRGPQKPVVEAKAELDKKEAKAEPGRKSATREVLYDQVQLAKVIVGYVGPAPLEGNAINAAVRILGAGKSSRLYHDLVYEQKIAQDVNATWDNGMMLGGQIELSATVQAGHTAEEVEKALLAEVAKLRAAPPATAELERARRAVQAHLYRSLENVGGFGGKADELNYYELRANDPGYFSKDLQDFLAVTPEAVQQAVNRYMGDEQRVVLHVLPEAAKEAAK
jgi:zinc protease